MMYKNKLHSMRILYKEILDIALQVLHGNKKLNTNNSYKSDNTQFLLQRNILFERLRSDPETIIENHFTA